VVKYGRARHATGYNITWRVRFACWVTNAIDAYSRYCFSTVRMVRRTRLNVDLVRTLCVLFWTLLPLIAMFIPHVKLVVTAGFCILRPYIYSLQKHLGRLCVCVSNTHAHTQTSVLCSFTVVFSDVCTQHLATCYSATSHNSYHHNYHRVWYRAVKYIISSK
jgi:hypothetical protein